MNKVKDIDCIVCGSCVVDLLVHPFELDQPVVGGQLYEVGPMRIEAGGIVSNSGATLARLGLKTEAVSFLGKDDFGKLILQKYKKLGIGTEGLSEHPTVGTSFSVVLIDPCGERSFVHCVGAPRELDKNWFEQHLDFFARSRAVMLGYFSLMPLLERDLPQIMKMLREVGCLTILEAAGDGGTLKDLAPTLSELDIYIPSYNEASKQTGETETNKILAAYRSCGAKKVVGVKRGTDGTDISPSPSELIHIDSIEPPGPVVDTTGAGDAFLAGFVAGILKGLTHADAGRLAAAAGACCVAGFGASEGLRDFAETAQLAGLSS